MRGMFLAEGSSRLSTTALPLPSNDTGTYFPPERKPARKPALGGFRCRYSQLAH